ncbi:MAG TPA: PKD domain-containing protein, partial [Candidatus Thermoplasmatota archaeon]|nr:PKD domain-containing protein [Candidatus Thermoplasmatota archaeon]
MRALLLVALLLAAPVAAAEQRIQARELAFEPARVVASEWETVRWTWPANETHGVALDGAEAPWCSPREGGCERFFGRHGEYRYHCPVHPEMRGVVVVERRGGDPSAPLRAFFVVRTQGLTATFDASAVAQSRTAVETYEWDFGDGARGSGRIVEHGYARAGEYLVRLTVVDELGNEDTGARRVNVSVPGDPAAFFRANASGRAVLFEA